jgi:hypothetical protein
MTSRTCELNAASDLQAVGRLQNQGTGIQSTSPILPQARSVSSSDTLRRQAEDAKRAGDYPAFWQLRRAFLLAQAAEYAVGGGRP